MLHRATTRNLLLPGELHGCWVPLPVPRGRFGTRFVVRDPPGVGDGFRIENERGEAALLVDGDGLRVHGAVSIRDGQGRELYRLTGRVADVPARMGLRRPDGSTAAVVHNALFSALRDRWKIEVPGGDSMAAFGDVGGHEYTIGREGDSVVAAISERWLRFPFRFGVEVEDAADAALLLAVVVAMEVMSCAGEGGALRWPRSPPPGRGREP